MYNVFGDCKIFYVTNVEICRKPARRWPVILELQNYQYIDIKNQLISLLSQKIATIFS